MEPGSELSRGRWTSQPKTRASPDAGDEADDDSLDTGRKAPAGSFSASAVFVVLLIVLAVNMLSGDDKAETQQSGRANRNDCGGPRPGIVCKRRYSRSVGRHCADEHPPGKDDPAATVTRWAYSTGRRW